MGGEEGAAIMEKERDFFVRELEAMGWGLAGEDTHSNNNNNNGGGDETAEMGAPPGGPGSGPGPGMNGAEWDGAPMQQQMEGPWC